MEKKIQKTLVDRIKPGKTDVYVWDTELKGFLLKVTTTGRKFYAYDYYFGNRRRRISLGEHGTVAPEEARNKALEASRQVANGVDPLTEKANAKTAPTITEFVDEYLERHARVHKKPRSVEGDERLTKDFIKPHLGDLKVADLTRPSVAKLHHELRATPTTANRVLACLSKMMNLAELWGYRPDGSNPCRHITRFKENKRTRFLSAEEIGRLSDVLTKEEQRRNDSWVAVQAIRVLLMTGMRMGEVLPLEWEWVDLDAQRIDLPDSKTGAKVVWLNSAAVDVLRNLQAYQERRVAEFEKRDEQWLGGRWVLPGRTNGKPLQWLESTWQRVRKSAKISDVRIHDLRHTVASIGAAEGLGLPIIGALLGHTQASTTQRYAHIAQSPALAAAEIIGQRISDAMNGAAKVVEVAGIQTESTSSLRQEVYHR